MPFLAHQVWTAGEFNPCSLILKAEVFSLCVGTWEKADEMCLTWDANVYVRLIHLAARFCQILRRRVAEWTSVGCVCCTRFYRKSVSATVRSKRPASEELPVAAPPPPSPPFLKVTLLWRTSFYQLVIFKGLTVLVGSDSDAVVEI